MKRAPDALGPAMEALGEAFKQDAEQWNELKLFAEWIIQERERKTGFPAAPLDEPASNYDGDPDNDGANPGYTVEDEFNDRIRSGIGTEQKISYDPANIFDFETGDGGDHRGNPSGGGSSDGRGSGTTGTSSSDNGDGSLGGGSSFGGDRPDRGGSSGNGSNSGGSSGSGSSGGGLTSSDRPESRPDTSGG